MLAMLRYLCLFRPSDIEQPNSRSRKLRLTVNVSEYAACNPIELRNVEHVHSLVVDPAQTGLCHIGVLWIRN